MQAHSYDIIIVGGGLVGSTLAVALAQQTSLSIAVLEAQSLQPPTFSAASYHHRVSAIALAAERILQALHVWPLLQQARLCSFAEIHVWDVATTQAIAFASEAIGERALGYIVENQLLQAALFERRQQLPQINFISPVTLTHVAETENKIKLSAADGRVFQATLAIAADGANSWLREQAGIAVKRHDYQQQAIVATVQTEAAHAAIARQVFLATGPLAFLPLADAHLSSIVWSLPNAEATRLLALESSQFNHALATAFAHRLGDVSRVDAKHAYPLYQQQTKHYVKSRVVLVGDAAHTVHPLAGQGLNMGLLDAASLCDVIVAANKTGDIANLRHLRHYERWRKADHAAMFAAIATVKQCCAMQHPLLQRARALGWLASAELPWLKNQLMRQAVGNRGGLPMMAKRSK